MFRPLLAATALTAALPAHAEPPRVVADIAPVHSLVAQVMAGLGTPDLLVEPGGDVHHLALRPSVARTLEEAQLIVQVGPELTPWLVTPLERLDDGATVLTLLDSPGWEPRQIDGEADDAHDEHEAHDTHDDHDEHDEHQAHEDHEAADHDGHAHEGLDPHAWLDPRAAAAWVEAIRAALAEADPGNADAYARNAAAATDRLAALEDEISRRLLDLPTGGWIAPHEAFGYFEERFAFPSVGAVSDVEDAAPGPAHLSHLRGMIADGTARCVLSGPGGDTRPAEMLVRGSDARTGTVDETGAGLEPGPDLYDALLTGIADSLEGCLAP